MNAPRDLLAPVRTWLWVVFFSIMALVAIGGTTRLTGSGLSITVWDPVMGAIPPLDSDAWNRAFDLYKESPEFLRKNYSMDLGEFKRIFFWEYLHRLAGRLLGLIFLVPWIWFAATGRLRGRARRLTAVAFLLGGLQGVLGWWMVKSGLVDVPRVSHYRLAAHLLLAFATAQYVLWLAVTLGRRRSPPGLLRGPLGVFVAVLVVQITWGALVAGLRGGQAAMTFPDFNGEYLPSSLFPAALGIRAAIDDPLTVHFIHRALALALVALGVLAAVRLRFSGRAPCGFGAGILVLLAAQAGLGAATVLSEISPPLAVAHQLGALVLLSWVTRGIALAGIPGSVPGGDLQRIETHPA